MAALWFIISSLTHAIIAGVSYRSRRELNLISLQKLSTFDYSLPASKSNPRFTDESIFYYELIYGIHFNEDKSQSLGSLPFFQARDHVTFSLLNTGMCIILVGIFIICMLQFTSFANIVQKGTSFY